jgi:hypothetical protein
MLRFIKDVDDNNINITATADKIYQMNKVVRDELLDSWVIDNDLYNNLSKNPYYIPTKLDEESVDRLWRNIENERAWKLIKNLWEWIQDEGGVSFNQESLLNYYNYIWQALNTTRRNTYINYLGWDWELNSNTSENWDWEYIFFWETWWNSFRVWEISA